MKYLLIMLMLAISTYAAPAHAAAGSLFPPEGVSEDSQKTCPEGYLLAWTGNSLKCTDPTPSITVTGCPSGQVIASIVKGVPTCQPTTGSSCGNYKNGQIVRIEECPACGSHYDPVGDRILQCLDGNVEVGIDSCGCVRQTGGK